MVFNDQNTYPSGLSNRRPHAKRGDLHALTTNLLKPLHTSSTGLMNLLCCYLRGVISLTNSTRGVICLKEAKLGGQERTTLIVDSERAEVVSREPLIKTCAGCRAFYEDNRSEPLIVHDGKPPAPCLSMQRPARSYVVIPIRYQETVMGVMTLTSDREEHYSTSHLEICQWFAHELAYLIRRYEVHDFIKATLGKNLTFVGTSDAMRSVDRFVQKASQVDLPVLIVGEFGSEKMYIACALHCEGPRRNYPFVEVGCPALETHTFKAELYERFKQADKGTIFLKGIDELEYKLQYQLAEFIESILESRISPPTGSRPDNIRIVASASKNLDTLVEKGVFCPALRGKIDFLNICIAPLRERREDIEPLIEYLLRKYTGVHTRRITKEALQLCKTYDWPSNVVEIERVIARLAVMSESETIAMEDLYAHAPKLVQHQQALPQTEPPASEPGRNLRAEPKRQASIDQFDDRLVSLADDLIQGEFVNLLKLHPNMQKALEYIARNYHQPISLTQLAHHACLSSSHLSYLFKRALGISFKPFLTLVRIKRAAQLLVDNPHQTITEISLIIGFSDLRHFERTFKRLLGMNPTTYRQSALEQERPLSWYHGQAVVGTIRPPEDDVIDSNLPMPAVFGNR